MGFFEDLCTGAQLIGIDPARLKGDLFWATGLQALAILQGAHEVPGVQ